MILRIFIFVVLLIASSTVECIAQDYIVGQHYFDENGYIEYVHGNFPLIISSPHGGEKKPESIPDRDCPNCVVVNDSYTFELANEIAIEVINLTECVPYIIFNKLHRSKLDPNRGIIEGADGNDEAESAWGYYHNHISIAQDSIKANHTRGLLVDIHGHAHQIQRLELGYLLSKAQLNQENEILDENNFQDNSSIRLLTEDNESALPFSQLLRGELSLGTMVSDMDYPAIPSSEDEFPESDPYFTGGYITKEYGSRDNDITDAIQIECNQDVRFNATIRKDFAKKLAQSLVEYMNLHYGFDGSDCLKTSISNTKQEQHISIYPNPASSHITFKKPIRSTIQVFNPSSQLLYSNSTPDTEIKMDIEHLPNGLYFVKFIDQKDNVRIHRFTKI